MIQERPVNGVPARTFPDHRDHAVAKRLMKGFGGVIAVAQRELVEREAWLTREQFLELLSVAQVLPGPNIVNLSMMIGDRFFGLRGAVVALDQDARVTRWR
mgnify:CR=1 FL=1